MAGPGEGGPGSHGSAQIHLGRAVLLIAGGLVVGLLLLHRGAGVSTSLAATGSSPTTAHRSSPPTVIINTPTTVALRSPQDIKVLVANGTSSKGAASQFSNRLHASGYNTLASTNTTTPAAASTVFYAPSYGPEAAVIASLLGLQPGAVQPLPQQAPVAQLHDAQILVVVGPDLAGQGTTSSSPSTTTAAATTTTVHRSTTIATTTTTRAATTTTSKP
jgi:hypothetical protein